MKLDMVSVQVVNNRLKPIGQANFNVSTVTDLDNSVFFKFSGNCKMIPCRQSISAILLVILDSNSCLTVGILHPQPAYCFDIAYLPDVPFIRVANWPCLNGQVISEWVIHNPSEKRIYLDKIELKTDELKTL